MTARIGDYVTAGKAELTKNENYPEGSHMTTQGLFIADNGDGTIKVMHQDGSMVTCLGPHDVTTVPDQNLRTDTLRWVRQTQKNLGL